jgi:hypothetical protein
VGEVVTKVGAARDAQGGWVPAQRPEKLRADVEANLRTLGVEQVHMVNLRMVDPGRSVLRPSQHLPGAHGIGFECDPPVSRLTRQNLSILVSELTLDCQALLHRCHSVIAETSAP